MKYSQLKQLLQQNKLQQFQQQIQQSSLVGADYDLLLRDVIKNKIKNFSKYYQLLIKKGADVNFSHSGGNKKSNLMVACEEGNIQCVQLLCSHKDIDFSLQDSTQRTAAYYAIQNKNKTDSQVILDKILTAAPYLISKPTNNDTMLILAIKKQKPQLVKILLKHDSDPNYIINDSGNTALHEALKLCKAKQTRVNRQIVKLLAEYGADPYIKNKKGKNAYQFADKYDLKTLLEEVQVRGKEKRENNSQINQNNKEGMNNQTHLNVDSKNTTLSINITKKDVKDQLQSLKTTNNNNRINVLKINNKNDVSFILNKADDIYVQNYKRYQKSRLKNKNENNNKQNQLISDDDEQDYDRIMRQGQSQQEQQQFSQQSQQQQLSILSQKQSQQSSLQQTEQIFEENLDKTIIPATSDKKNNKFFQSLSQQMTKYSQNCRLIHSQAQKQLQQFISKLTQYVNSQHFDLKLYGSFAVGLWMGNQNSDVDILLVPRQQGYGQNDANNNIINYVEQMLDKVQGWVKKEYLVRGCVKNKRIKVPMLKMDVEIPIGKVDGERNKNNINNISINNNLSSNSKYNIANSNFTTKLRKMEITIYDIHHNGLQICHYISQNIKIYPQLVPLFFTIKSLSYYYKLQDPKHGGIRTYAIIVMILSFFQTVVINMKDYSLGELLVRFLCFFGFLVSVCVWDIGGNNNGMTNVMNSNSNMNMNHNNINNMVLMEQQHNNINNMNNMNNSYSHNMNDMQATMLLHILDPLNHSNNIGKKTKAFQINAMFKAAYIALHTHHKGSKLQFMFDSAKIMIPF